MAVAEVEEFDFDRVAAVPGVAAQLVNDIDRLVGVDGLKGMGRRFGWRSTRLKKVAW